ncbi:MAG TPA: hypothetical protein VNZ45_17645 [Bacteroidia bacterium]|jgi:hypothetical protein|nr:hypothetical protein [Bacteroidia bacterium]
MRTNKSTKIMLSLGVTLLTLGGVKAQTSTPAPTPAQTDAIMNQTNAISLITDGAGTATKGLNIWGYAFGDYAYVNHGDSAGRGSKIQYKGSGAASTGNPFEHQNAIEVRRAYLGFDYNINKKFSAYALLAYEGDYDVNNNRTVYLKYIYFKWKNIWKGTDLKIGQQATCSFANKYNTEPLMGYRASEKTIMDMHGVDGSSDMAIALEGKIATFKSDDSTKQSTFIGYMAQMGDNSGNTPVPDFTGAGTALNTTSDKLKKFRGNLYVNTLNSALTVGVYGDYENFGNVPIGKSSTVFQRAVSTAKVYAAYNSKWFGVGAEYFMQNMTNGEIETYAKVAGTPTGTNDTTTATQSGYSIFAHGTIIQKRLNVFVRYDNYTPDTKYTYTATSGSALAHAANENFASSFSNIGGVSYSETFVNAGVDWTPTDDKRVHFMPNIWYYSINNGYGSGALKTDNYMVYRLTFLFAF